MQTAIDYGPPLFAALLGSFGLVVFALLARYFARLEIVGFSDLILAVIAFDLALWADPSLFKTFMKNLHVAQMFQTAPWTIMGFSVIVFFLGVYVGEVSWIRRDEGYTYRRDGLFYSWLMPVAWLAVHASMMVSV
jgi:hypothetical protein